MKIKLHRESRHVNHVYEYELDTSKQYYINIDSGDSSINTLDEFDKLFEEFYLESYNTDNSRDKHIAKQLDLCVEFKYNGDIDEYQSGSDDVAAFQKLSELDRYETYKSHVNNVCLEPVSLKRAIDCFYNPPPRILTISAITMPNSFN